jgi:hypothetical protein
MFALTVVTLALSAIAGVAARAARGDIVGGPARVPSGLNVGGRLSR